MGEGADVNEAAGHDKPGFMRRTLSRLSATDEEVQARDLQSQCHLLGATPISEAKDREVVDVAGTVRSVTLRPVAGVPALEADLYDGSGAVTLVFLGRRSVAGIHPGRTMSAHGRLAKADRRTVIYNPAYELVAAGKHK